MFKLWNKVRWILLILIVIISTTLFLKDGIISYFFEKYASEANRAKVEVDGLKLNVFKRTLTWDRLQVTDPHNTMKNILDTGDLKIEIELLPLLENRIVIDKFELDNVNFNTERKNDGRIAGLEPRPKLETPMLETFKKKLEVEKKDIPILNIKELNSKEELEKILDELDIEVVKNYEDEKAYIKERIGYWETAISEEKYEKKLLALNGAVESLKQEIEEMGSADIAAVNEKVQKLTRLTEEINAAMSSLKEEKSKFESDFNELKNRSRNFSAAAKADLSKIAAFKDMGSDNWQYVSEALFGEALSNAIYSFVETFEMITSKLEKGDKGVEEDSQYPKFWIKDGSINLAYEGLSIKGYIKDLVDDNVKVDRDSIVEIMGEAAGKKVKLNVLLDTRNDLKKFDVALENFSMSDDFRGYYLKPFSGSNFDLLQNLTIKDGILDLKTKMNFDQVDLKSVAGNIAIANEKIKAIYLDTIKNVKGLELDIDYKNNGELFKFTTNIDEILASNIRMSLKNEIEKFQSDLRNNLNARVTDLQNQLDSELALYEKKFDDRISFVEKGMLENTTSLDLLKKQILKERIGDKLDIGIPGDIFEKLR